MLIDQLLAKYIPHEIFKDWSSAKLKPHEKPIYLRKLVCPVTIGTRLCVKVF